MGESTLRPQQDAVRAVFVPIARLQRDLDLAGRANVMLLSAKGDAAPDAGAAERLLNAAATLPDFGLGSFATRHSTRLIVESETGTDGPSKAVAAAVLDRACIWLPSRSGADLRG